MKGLRRARVSFFCVASVGPYDLALPFFPTLEAPSRSLSPATSTPPSPPEATKVASSSKLASRRSNAEIKAPKSTFKAKGKTKTIVAAAVEGEDVDMQDGDKEAVAAKESDPPEEDNDSREEELEDVEERKAASKRRVCRFLCTAPR